MNLALNWLLALATLATAVWALWTARARTSAVALAANTLCIAALCARLAAPLVGAVVALLGIALLVNAPRPEPPVDAAPSRRRHWLSTLLPVAGGILLAIALGSIFYVGYAPGQTALGASRPLPDGADAARLAAALLDDHGLAALVVALLTLAAALTTRLRREAR